MLPAINWYLDRPIFQHRGCLKSWNGENPLFVKSHFFCLSTWFPEHRNLLSKKFFYKNVPRSGKMKIIWFLNFFETSGGTKNRKNRKKCRFSAYFQFFIKFFGVFTPDGQRKSCSSWKMPAFWHHDDLFSGTPEAFRDVCFYFTVSTREILHF